MAYTLRFKHEPLHADCMYHIYNRANGNEKMFLSTGNYNFFLKQYSLYVAPIAHTFCYCLMPNHFHFLIRIKSWDELSTFFNGLKKLRRHQKPERWNKATLFEDESPGEPEEYSPEQMEKLLTKQFSNLFSSYSQAFNKEQMRMGSMFMKNYKRKKVVDNQYLRTLVNYIHLNPVAGALCNAPENWQHSSYKALTRNDSSIVNVAEVMYWFHDVHNFRKTHKNVPELQDW
jgi:putative transposase